jgi:hypothetical protein
MSTVKKQVNFCSGKCGILDFWQAKILADKKRKKVKNGKRILDFTGTERNEESRRKFHWFKIQKSEPYDDGR